LAPDAQDAVDDFLLQPIAFKGGKRMEGRTDLKPNRNKQQQQ
jgi:hypothetical protein